MPESHHTGHIRMRATNLAETNNGDRKVQQNTYSRFLCRFVGLYRQTETVTASYKSLSESNCSRVDATLFSSSCHTSHVPIRIMFDWGDSAKQMPNWDCSLALHLWWMWLRTRSRSITKHSPFISQADRGLREYHCTIITGPWLYESMEHAANITPCNTLPMQHAHICP